MSFRDGNWNQRFAVMGDIAEGAFERYYPENWVRYGLSRPPLRVDLLPERIRYTPDYLATRGFVEVKGVGRDRTLKIKVSEFSCMNFWHQVHPMGLFVWDSHAKQWTTFSIEDLRRWIDSGFVALGFYPEGKAYFGVDFDALPNGDVVWNTPADV